MTRLLLLTILLVIAAGAVSAQPLEDLDPLETVADLNRDARLALFDAQNEREKENYVGAAEAVVEFINRNPEKNDHYLLRFSAGADYMRADMNEAALAQYQRCVELEERFAQGWLNLGELAYRLEKYELAGDALVQGYQYHEDRPPHILYFGAAAYLIAGRTGSALPILERLCSGQHGPPEMEWFRGLISACMELEEKDKGTQAIKDMIDWHGEESEAWDLAYQYHAGVGEYREAAIAMTVASYMRPFSRQEYVQLGDLYSVISVPAAACKYYSTAFDSIASPAEIERLASAYLASYDMEAAQSTLENALDTSPTPRLWSLLGDLHYMERRYEEAYEAYKQAAGIDPEQGRPFMMMAYCAMELENFEDALVQLGKAAGFPDTEERATRLAQRIRDSAQ